MKRVKFSVVIAASPERIWRILWDDKTYRQWTSVFDEGSHAVSEWNEGGKVLFLTGTGDGMYSLIDKKIDAELMSFKHLGTVKEGKELPIAEGAESWAGTHEIYTLSKINGSTELTAEIDVIGDYEDFFMEKFPLALAKVKALSE